MPFNSTLPLNSSEVIAAELREQFNGLKDLIDAQAAQILDLTQQLNDWSSHITTIEGQLGNFVTQADVEVFTANNINGVADLGLTLNDPPETAQMLQILDKLNESIVALHR